MPIWLFLSVIYLFVEDIQSRKIQDRNTRLRFVILMTDTWRVERCCIIILIIITYPYVIKKNLSRKEQISNLAIQRTRMMIIQCLIKNYRIN